MTTAQHGRSTALVMALVGGALASVLLFSPFVVEYAAQAAAPDHVRDAWHLTTRSELDGGQRVATFWAVLVVLTTLVTLLGVWAGSHLGTSLPLVVGAGSSAVATVVGFAVAGEGSFGDGHAWSSAWGLTAWQAAHVLVVVALAVFASAGARSRPGR